MESGCSSRDEGHEEGMSVWVFGHPHQGRWWYQATDGGNSNLDLFKSSPQGKAHNSSSIICRVALRATEQSSGEERLGGLGGWLAGVHTLQGLCCPCICPCIRGKGRRERKKRKGKREKKKRKGKRETLGCGAGKDSLIFFLGLEKIHKCIAYDRTKKPLRLFSSEHQVCLHKQRDIEC